MEPSQIYIDSAGKEHFIPEMHGAHLVNALLKVAGKIATAPELESQPELKVTFEELKAEVGRRLKEYDEFKLGDIPASEEEVPGEMPAEPAMPEEIPGAEDGSIPEPEPEK